MRRLWGVLAVLLMLASCTERVGGEADRTEAPAGPFDLASPIEMARVSPEATASTTELPGQDGAPLNVEEAFLTITRLERATVEQMQTTWGLTITMTEDDGAVFSSWTENHTGEQVAMIVDGEVVSAPVVQEAIPGPEVVISANYSQSEAQALLHQITGR